MGDVDLLQGTLDLLVLRALSFGPRHGYAVARFIHHTSGETFTVLDGALYTALHRLEARRSIEAHWALSDRGKRAKFYQLTTRGRQELRNQIAAWAKYAGAVDGVLSGKPREA